MENRTDFDLNERILNWRESLGNRPGIREEDVEELESHLRETFEGLGKAGLSHEEAFLIAARRIGSPGELEEQFATVNAAAVWKTRAGWMIAGVLWYWAWLGLSETLSKLAWFLGARLEIIGLKFGFLGLAIHAALLVLLGWVVIRHRGRATVAGTGKSPHRKLIGLRRLIIWFAVVSLFASFVNVSLDVVIPRLFSPESLGGYYYFATRYHFGSLSHLYIGPLSYLLFVAFGVWVASGKAMKSRMAGTLGSLLLLISVTACLPGSKPSSSATATASTNASWRAASSGEQTPSGHCVLVSSDTNRRSIHC